MTLEQCVDLSAADWLVEQSDDWARLAVRGPLGFPAYARLRFLPDPSDEGQSVNDVETVDDGRSEADLLAVVLAILADHTATPESCYFCVWNGWSSITPAIGAPEVKIPNRDYFLFHGTVRDIAYWQSQHAREADSRYGVMPDPAFAWPADHSWCLANDVDPHFATIGASCAAIEKVLADPRIDAVADDPAQEPPHYCF